MFALRFKKTKEMVGFYSSASNGDCCVDVMFRLTSSFGKIWVVKSRETAEYAANNSSEWYNACYEEPVNDYVGELEVVELTVK